MLWRHFFRYILRTKLLSWQCSTLTGDGFDSYGCLLDHQNEPRRVAATDGCHSWAVSRSHRNSRWHGDLWGGPARPWCKPHQPLKRMPEGGIGTEQQEDGTSKRVSHILQGRVQHTRHASRPQEGPMGSRRWQRPRTSNNFSLFQVW